MSETEQELARLRAQVAELQAEKNRTVDTQKDAALSKMAAHANREAQMYRQIQTSGDAGGFLEVSETALSAASAVMRDMGLA